LVLHPGSSYGTAIFSARPEYLDSPYLHCSGERIPFIAIFPDYDRDSTYRGIYFSGRTKICSCRVRIQILRRSRILYTSREDDDYIWLDDERDLAHFQDKNCEFVLLSSLETPETKTFKEAGKKFAPRLGLGVIRIRTCDMSNPVDEWVLLG
jgi:hypothetical protein